MICGGRFSYRKDRYNIEEAESDFVNHETNKLWTKFFLNRPTRLRPATPKSPSTAQLQASTDPNVTDDSSFVKNSNTTSSYSSPIFPFRLLTGYESLKVVLCCFRGRPRSRLIAGVDLCLRMSTSLIENSRWHRD